MLVEVHDAAAEYSVQEAPKPLTVEALVTAMEEHEKAVSREVKAARRSIAGCLVNGAARNVLNPGIGRVELDIDIDTGTPGQCRRDLTA